MNCTFINAIIFQSKMKYYFGHVEDNQSDQRKLFGVVNRLLNVKNGVKASKR